MSRINAVELVDRSKLHPIQIIVLVLCGLCMTIDGFDVQAMAYVAPALLNEWNVAKPALGPVFSAGLAGVMLGSLVFSIVADNPLAAIPQRGLFLCHRARPASCARPRRRRNSPVLWACVPVADPDNRKGAQFFNLTRASPSGVKWRHRLLYLSSFARAFRKLSSSRFPAYSAAAWDWYPLRPTITPIGVLYRLNSQRHGWGRWPVSIVAMK